MMKLSMNGSEKLIGVLHSAADIRYLGRGRGERRGGKGGGRGEERNSAQRQHARFQADGSR
jgi:hypothetical protein